MAKQLKDYLHFYLGCEVLDVPVSRYELKAEVFVLDCGMLENYLIVEGGVYSRIKPILRPLSDITEDEKIEVTKESSNPEQIRWYISNHFDIFDLIKEGLAVDKTTFYKPRFAA